jgi:hypothetical protein
MFNGSRVSRLLRSALRVVNGERLRRGPMVLPTQDLTGIAESERAATPPPNSLDM